MSTVAACSSAEPPGLAEPVGCRWFQRCGVAESGAGCGTCDDGDPCTTDQCTGNAECTHVVASDACHCEPLCAASAARIGVVQELREGDGGLLGLDGPSALAVTGDGRDLYVGTRRGKTLTLFTADPGANAGYAPAQRIDVGAVTGLALAADEHVLAVTDGDALRLFSRDTATGALTPMGQLAGAFEGVAATGARVVATSGGRLVALDVGAGGGSAIIPRPEVLGARSLVFDATGAHLYAAAFDASQLVVMNAADPGWAVIDVERDALGLDHPDAVALVAGERMVAVAGYCDSGIALLTRADDGTVTVAGGYAPEVASAACDTNYTTMGLNHPGALVAVGEAGLAVASGRADLFALDFFQLSGTTLDGRVRVRTGPPVFDAGQNAFSTESVPASGPPSATAFRGMVAAVRSHDRLFVSTAVTNAIGIFDDAPREDAVGYLQRGAGGARGLACNVRIERSVDGAELYVAQRCMPGIGVVAVDPERGTLTPRATVPLPGAHVGSENGAAVAPAGPSWVGVTVTSDTAPRVALLHRDEATRALSPGPELPLEPCAGQRAFPVGIGASPDGRDLYVADFQAGAIGCVHWVHRDAAGSWTMHKAVESADVGGAESLIVTADGRDVYVASHIASAVTLLRRDQATGSVTVVAPATHPDLHGAEFVALSPDERSLYASSPLTNAVVVFTREPTTGALTVAQSLFASDAADLRAPAGLVVSPDGAFVYVTARDANALVTFTRAGDGRLAPLETTTGAFQWPNGITISPDGKHVTVASVTSSSLTVLRRVDPGQDGCLGKCPQ